MRIALTRSIAAAALATTLALAGTPSAQALGTTSQGSVRALDSAAGAGSNYAPWCDYVPWICSRTSDTPPEDSQA